jgi:endonuclease/exonuclease/phosphatase family metal-dependent hydrolase
MECDEAWDGKTIDITNTHLDVYKGGQRIRHIEMTTNIKLELNRISHNAFIQNIGWAKTFCVWLVAIDGGDMSNQQKPDDWTLIAITERNRLENRLIQQMV